MVACCVTRIPGKSQGIDTGAVHRAHSGFTSFTCTCVYLMSFTYTHLCVCIGLCQFIMYRFVSPPPCSGYRAVPHCRDLLLPHFRHTHPVPVPTSWQLLVHSCHTLISIILFQACHQNGIIQNIAFFGEEECLPVRTGKPARQILKELQHSAYNLLIVAFSLRSVQVVVCVVVVPLCGCVVFHDVETSVCLAVSH